MEGQDCKQYCVDLLVARQEDLRNELKSLHKIVLQETTVWGKASCNELIYQKIEEITSITQQMEYLRKTII